ncbi:hypothetical protein VPH35_056592 [Triticum aestivum]|uniref:Uncharacterized protein n=1 Tax=Triticum turgidum subsp. durum TaxID=4567 RepID=A0A9R1R1C3_TRITD|nr:unnamed protein product [Triticum turgidum subsp. durum]
MSYHPGSSNTRGNNDGLSAWPSNLGNPETTELCRYDLLLPSGCYLPQQWKTSTDNYPTLGPGAMTEELRTHIDSRHNIQGRRDFWRGKVYDDVITAFRLAVASVTHDLTSLSGRCHESDHRQPALPVIVQGPAPWEHRRGSDCY